MRIYLAGKMDAVHGRWRDYLLTAQQYDWLDVERAPHWEVVTEIDDSRGWSPDDIELRRWPIEPNTFVLGKHEYVGPYRLTFRLQSGEAIPSKCHGGYFHGSLLRGQHGCPNSDRYGERITEECERALRRADLCFAYINTFDCYGTLAEIGYARAAGVYTAIAIDHEVLTALADKEEGYYDAPFWFICTLADVTVAVPRRHEEVRAIHDWWDDDQVESFCAQSALKEAIVEWAGRSPRPLAKTVPEAELYRTIAEVERRYALVLQRYTTSFAQIAQWTSDPRVRDEAQRMLRLLQAG